MSNKFSRERLGFAAHYSYITKFLFFLLLSLPLTAQAIDTDADGVDDVVDNCQTISNPQQNDDDGDGVGNLCDNCLTLSNVDQRDSNNDGFGNRCDADLNNDGAVNFADLGIMKSVFFTADPDADLNGDGAVNFADLGIMKSLFFSAPGPIAEPAITVTPGSLDLGDVFVGGSTTGTLTVSNGGSAPLDVSSITVGGPFTVFAPTVFSIESGGADRIVSIGFAPVTDGTFTEILTISNNTGQAETVTITGRGVLPIQPGDIQAATSLEFALVEEDTTAEQVLTVSNTGLGPLSVTGALTDDMAFSVSTTAGETFPLSLNPGDTRNLVISFTPPLGSAGTSQTATLTIQSDDPDEGSLTIALDGTAIAPVAAVPNNPLVSARVQFNPFDLITAATCSSVGGEIEFGVGSSSADTYQVILTDQGGASVSSAAFAMLDGAGTGTFSGISACSLADGTISIKVVATVGGTVLPAFAGTPAVKNTSTLSAPVLDPLEPVSVQSALQVCGTSRANTTVRIEGGTSVVSTTLDALTTNFCLDVPLRPNTSNTLIASAVDDLAVAPKPVASAQPVTVVHLDPSEIIIAEADSRPLTTQEVETLVDNGVIDLDDPSNFNVSMFTVVLTIGSFPVTISQPVAVPVSGGSSGGGTTNVATASYGGSTSGGWAPLPEPLVPGTPPPPVTQPVTGCTTGCSQIIVINTPSGQTIPGVIIIDGRIKTLKEFFQITIAIQNTSSDFTLIDMQAMVGLPAGLSAVRAGLGTNVADVNTAGEIDQVVLGSIAPGATGTGQFIVRGDGIGTHAVNVDFDGFLTGGGLVDPFPVSGSAGTTVEVFGPPELDVVLRHPSRVGQPDVLLNEIYTLTVDITNTSNRPALYSSLELFLGGDARLVDANGDPVPDSSEVRDFGNVEAGETVSASFLVQSLVEGEIIACQGLAAENITLTVDTGPDGTDCNIANTFPANFQPLPVDAAPTVLGINPLNGQPNIPVTTSVIATFTPESACLVADTWTNVVTDFIDPANTGLGLQVISADLVTAGTIFLEEMDPLGNPVRHIPIDLTLVTPPAGGTTIATMRLGLSSPNSQFFLTDNTTYRATLKGGASGICSAASLAPMANDFVWTFSTEETCDALGTPQVTLLDPVNGSIDRPLNQTMVLEFTDRLDPATLAFDPLNLGLSSFGVYANALETAGDITGGTAVAGQAALSNFNRTLTFTPSPNLPEGAPIHIRLTNALRDTCGNPLETAANGVKLFSFTTQPPDTEAPAAPTVNPLPALTNLGSITVSGSAEVLSTVMVTGGSNTVTTQASSSGLFSVSVPLSPDQSNTLQVQATDASNNASPLTTVDTNSDLLVVTNDSTAPAVNAIAPANGATGIPRDAVITVALSEPHDPDTVNSLNVTVDGGVVAGTLTLDGDSGFTFTPTSLLDFNRTYTVRMRASGIRDRASNGFASDFVTTFTTETFPAPALTGILPNSGIQGQVVQVTFTGTELATVSAVSSANPGISGSIVSATDTSVVADITIGSLAATGATTLGLTTLGGTVTLPFTVNQKPPVITSINPVQGIRGTTVNATLFGSGLSNISSISIDGTGVTLNDLATGNDSSHNIELVIAAGATLEVRTITVITPGGTDSVSFSVVAPTPVINNINPTVGLRGQTITAAINGSALTDITSLTISGSGVTITDLGSGDTSRLDVQLVIAANATLGARTITLTTLGGTDTVLFTVLEFHTPASIEWTAPGGGDWNDPANWSENRVPGPTDDVRIAATGPVTINGGTAFAKTLVLFSDLSASSTSLSVNSPVSPAILVDAAANLELDENVTLTVTNGLTLNGTLTLSDFSDGGFGLDTNRKVQLDFSGTQTLDGTGEVVFDNGGSGDRDANVMRAIGGGTLTVAPGMTVRGGDGVLGDATTGTLQFLGNLNADVLSRVIQLAGDYDAAGGSLTIGAGAGSFIVSNLTISNTTIDGPGTMIVAGGGTTFNNVTLNKDLELDENVTLTVTNGLTLNGTLTLSDFSDGGFGLDTNRKVQLDFSGTQTLDGTGEVVFDNGGSGDRDANVMRAIGGGTLTVAPGMTVRGGDGVLGDATTGTLQFLGNLNADVLNRVIQLAGDYDAAGGSLTIGAGAGSFIVSSVTISNTTIDGPGTMIVTGGLTAFDNVTLNKDLELDENVTLTVTNGLTLNGTLTLSDFSDGGFGLDTNRKVQLDFFGTQTLDGTGEVVFDNGGSGDRDANVMRAIGGGTLTVAPGMTVRGGDGVLGDATTGTLQFLGNLNADVLNRVIQLAGDYDAAGGSLTIGAGAGTFVVSSVTISNTTIDGPGTMIVTGGLTAFDNVTLNKGLELDEDVTLTVTNGLTLNGTLTLSDFSDSGFGLDSGRKVQLDFSGTQTLDGTGEVVFDNGGSGDRDTNVMRAIGGGTLTVAPGMTVRGGDGTLGDATSGLINSGTILADVGNRTIAINAMSFDNQGSMGATGNGRLTVNNLATHSGTIDASTGGLVTINGDLTQTVAGTVTVGIDGSAGRVDVAGTANLAGTLDVQLLNGFVPSLAQRFQFMTFGARAGLFDTTQGLLIGGGLAFDLDTTDPADLELVVVPN